MSLPPPDPPGVRISDSDRERAAERLHQALAEGRISVTELEERLATVYAALYPGDLRAPLADLPGGDVVALPVVGAVPHAEPLVLRAGASGIKRTGEWSVPARIQVKGGMGSVMMDFEKAVIAHPVVEIELVLGTGSATLIVPDESTANVDAFVATMGSVTSNVDSQPKTGGPHFVVRGRTRLGSLTVRRRRKFGRLRF